jgi:hypothetical protein
LKASNSSELLVTSHQESLLSGSSSLEILNVKTEESVAARIPLTSNTGPRSSIGIGLEAEELESLVPVCSLSFSEDPITSWTAEQDCSFDVTTLILESIFRLI